MNEVRDTARLAEQTVQAIARDEVEPIIVRRKRRVGGRSSRVEVLKVDPRVMAAARRLAKGDMTRIEIRSATEVIVHNPRD